MAPSPILIIHGGAGNAEISKDRQEQLHHTLEIILKNSYPILCEKGAYDAVLHALCQMEDHPLFNAGTGSCLQSDGQIRMSAGLMNGASETFSGVINVQNIQNAILLADRLQQEKNTVLAGELATQYAKEHGFLDYNPMTPERSEEFKKRQEQNIVTQSEDSKNTFEKDTVGAVALDAKGHIVAACSTGGIGNEIPGRVSDCPTIAGTYATAMAGVSCTGIGEQIVNHALAAKIVAWVEAGIPLKKAVEQALQKGQANQCAYGLIALSASGQIAFGKTTRHLIYGYFDGTTQETFLSAQKI